MSLYPTIERSCPGRMPRLRAAPMIPMARLSFAAKIAVGRASARRSVYPASLPASTPYPVEMTRPSGRSMPASASAFCAPREPVLAARGEPRAGDDSDVAVAEVEQVPDGEVAAGLVVAECRGADAVGAEHEHVRDASFTQRRRKGVVDARGRQDQSVDTAVEQRLGGAALGVCVIAAGGHDREVSLAACGAFDGFEHQGHDRVGEARDEDSDRSGGASAEIGREDVAAIAEAFGGGSHLRGGRGAGWCPAVIEDAADGRDTDSRLFGNVAQGHHGSLLGRSLEFHCAAFSHSVY